MVWTQRAQETPPVPSRLCPMKAFVGLSSAVENYWSDAWCRRRKDLLSEPSWHENVATPRRVRRKRSLGECAFARVVPMLVKWHTLETSFVAHTGSSRNTGMCWKKNYNQGPACDRNHLRPCRTTWERKKRKRWRDMYRIVTCACGGHCSLCQVSTNSVTNKLSHRTVMACLCITWWLLVLTVWAIYKKEAEWKVNASEVQRKRGAPSSYRKCMFHSLHFTCNYLWNYLSPLSICFVGVETKIVSRKRYCSIAQAEDTIPHCPTFNKDPLL